MKQHPFIFSNAWRSRLKRHLFFWAFWGLFQGFLYAFIPVTNAADYLNHLPSAMLNSFLFLPDHMFLSYALMYFVIPVYVVKNRYGMACLWTGVFILVTACFSSLVAMYLVVPAREAILPQRFLLNAHSGPGENGRFYLALMAGLRGGLTVGGLAAAIKLMKHWYTEGQRNLQLQKVAVESQLQVLKAQVHPHFLFNTLNNIYSHTQNTSPVASKLLMGLSDILRYMLYECNQPMVSLAKELKMIEDYIALEKIRYGNRFELHVDFPIVSKEHCISPLLLLPLVENCFKHGISNVIEQPWLNLYVSLQENTLIVQLINSKPVTEQASQQAGIGIENVRRRLVLLYPAKHDFTIRNEEEVFIVNLKLEVDRRKAASSAVTTSVAENIYA